MKSVTPRQQVVKVVNDELIAMLGAAEPLALDAVPPVAIMMVGLQGSGKTTFSGKLALYLKNKKKKKPLLVACDVYRPAAIDQLYVLGEQIDVPVFSDREEKNPVKIAQAAIKQAKKENHDVVIIDTAGRLAVDEVLMKEISDIHQTVKPEQTLFVGEAMTGQDAVNTAKVFNDTLNEITIREKENKKKTAAKTIRDHFFLQFNTGPQRECLYVKNIQ